MDHPLTLLGFMEMYATQDACRRALLEQRRREGFRCPRDRRPRRVPALLLDTTLLCSWLHPLKDWSLQETRGGSPSLGAPRR